MEQSPLDLPPPKKAIPSTVAPIFKYEETHFKVEENSADGKWKEGDNLKLEIVNGAVRIRAPSFGKVVALDGSIFQAHEILFNSPSNHRINGETFDLEMQVIHTGISKGDIAKHLILTFLFKRKAGAQNKLLESLELFNLPNPLEQYREIRSKVFIPQVLLQEGDEDIGQMIPFSFYTYSGSLMEPPCTERTTVYVASKPLETSFYSVQLLREALRIPEQVDQQGNMLVVDSIIDNHRELQRQHGRPIWWFDSSLCDVMLKNSGKPKEVGHYEKVIRPARRYFYINGNEPSGIPNAWVVTEKEALSETDLPKI